jgi:hypothetical protein
VGHAHHHAHKDPLGEITIRAASGSSRGTSEGEHGSQRRPHTRHRGRPGTAYAPKISEPSVSRAGRRGCVILCEAQSLQRWCQVRSDEPKHEVRRRGVSEHIAGRSLAPERSLNEKLTSTTSPGTSGRGFKWVGRRRVCTGPVHQPATPRQNSSLTEGQCRERLVRHRLGPVRPPQPGNQGTTSPGLPARFPRLRQPREFGQHPVID